MERTKPLISILTATYNRRDLIQRTYFSILENTKYGEKIEWLIMDDGSTDDTREVVEKMRGNSYLTIRYFRQKNAGKMAAINRLVELAEGTFMMDLDSDDYLSKDAIKIIRENACDIPLIYGFVFLKSYPNGKIMGERFKNTDYNRTMFDISYRENLKGERAIVFISSVRKKYMHRLEKEEKFVTEARLYNEMDKKRSVFVFNEILQICEYQEDGYTKNISDVLFKYPLGYYMYFKELLEFNFAGVRFKNRMYILKHYILYSHLTKKWLDLSTVKDFWNKVLLVLMYVPGIIKARILMARLEAEKSAGQHSRIRVRTSNKHVEDMLVEAKTNAMKKSVPNKQRKNRFRTQSVPVVTEQMLKAENGYDNETKHDILNKMRPKIQIVVDKMSEIKDVLIQKTEKVTGTIKNIILKIKHSKNIEEAKDRRFEEELELIEKSKILGSETIDSLPERVENMEEYLEDENIDNRKEVQNIEEQKIRDEKGFQGQYRQSLSEMEKEAKIRARIDELINSRRKDSNK